MGGTMIEKILVKLCAFSSEQLIGIANKALNDRQEILERSEKEKARLQIINSRLLARLAMTERERNEWKAEAERLKYLETFTFRPTWNSPTRKHQENETK
jgi:hypothetical protein